MKKEWTVYQGSIVHGFDFYELQINPDNSDYVSGK